jgi:DNA segregation ATPase FtsK/SpoIIIE-like protein
MLGYIVLAACAAAALSLVSWTAADASLMNSSSEPTHNLLGTLGAILADLIMQLFGLSGVFLILPPVFWSLQLITRGRLEQPQIKIIVAIVAVVLLACAAAALPAPESWRPAHGLGGLLGDQLMRATSGFLALMRPERSSAAAGLFCLAGGLLALAKSLGLSREDIKLIIRRPGGLALKHALRRWLRRARGSGRSFMARREPTLQMPGSALRAQPAFSAEPPYAMPPGFNGGTSRSFRHCDPQLELPPDETSNIARRFAPARRDDASTPVEMAGDQEAEHWPHEQLRDRVEPDGRGGDFRILTAPEPFPHPHEQLPHRRSHAGWPSYSTPRRHDPAFDDLYGRAVAIVLRDRKASKEYLQQRLTIGYMRASDLVERMEYEGILGAPVYNGVRPILIDGPGSSEV